MTYCVGMWLDRGLVFMSDTRTNAGVDNISTARKLFTFEKQGERFITILTSGNLATTQSVISMLEERTKAPADRSPSIMEAPSMFQVARIVGQTLREVIATTADTGQQSESTFDATLIVGDRLPEVRMVINRSPCFSNVNSLRAVEMLSTPALVRVSDIKTRPRSNHMPTQYVMECLFYCCT